MTGSYPGGIIRVRQRTLTFAALSISIIPIAGAQAPGPTQLTYVANSTTKLEQVIGDCDDQAQAI